MRAEGAAYLPVARGNTLALRAGGEQVFGDFPVQEAAFLGGGQSLRGYARNRFAGDAAVWGNAELRSGFGRANLGVARGNLGGILLADAGRVYFDGRSEGGWHPVLGGGLYFSMLDRAYTGSVIAAHGAEGWRASIQFGLPF
jgi:hemolysin activation/secretion protein